MSKKLIPAYLLTFVNVLGFSILMPVLPFIVNDYGAPKWVFGLLLTLYSTFQFLGAPFLGSLSDTKGRKPILLISQAGTLLSWIIFACALLLPDFPVFGLALPLLIIGLSRILDGITGGNVSTTNAYVSDITTRKEKSYVFGYLGGVAGLGFIVGPALGGFSASSSIGYLGTVLVSMGISVITLLTIIFWLKESHPEEKRVPRNRQPMWKSIFIVRRVRELNPSPLIKSLFILKAFFASMMAFYIASISLYLIDLFKFDEGELGMFLLVAGAFLAFNQAFLSKQFIKRLGEFRTLLIGLGLSTIGLVAITLTSDLYWFIGFYYILNLGLSLSFPTFNALITIHANPQKQGEILGISESINSLATAVFPVLSAALYGIIGYQLYYIIAALPLIAFILALSTIKRLGKNAFN
ncbi:MAG: MFS transporter [Crocinitomicaceae bacterium]|nr:MFS transporter [Flavobacteriales bacterium]NQZ37770.1 MFS transporter [Crocinitomicaceae bacterium]